MKVLAENLKQIRRTWNLSQLEIAELTRTNQTSYSFYEKGLREPPIRFCIIISDMTKIPVERLWKVRVSELEIPRAPIQQSEEDEPPDEPPDELTKLIRRILKEEFRSITS